MKQQPPPCSPQAHHPLESGATDLTGGTRLSPSDHTISPHTPDPPCQDLPAPVPDAVSPQAEEEEEEEEEEGCSSSITLSVSIQTGFDRETDQENQREGVRGEEDLHQTALGVENGEEDEEGDTNGLCSDTESSASLSMDVPPLSPPGHQSPPVSPSPFSPPPLQSEHSDQCSDEFSPSPAHENDIVPDSESRADSPLSTSESFTNSYPKTYAEFYNESYPQSESMTEPFTESFTEPYTKSYPQSFPKPLKMVCYPDSDRESHKGSEANSDEPFSESCSEPFSVRRKGRVYQEAGDIEPQPHSAWSGGVAGSTRNLPHWRGRSVGSRLHHYDDATSDGEGESLKDGPRNLGLLPRDVEGEAQSERASSGQPGSVGATEELVGAELTPPLEGHSEDWVRGSGDAVSLAIRDIREAIEEVKTKTVRSPYTPDQPVQPVWVMRQEVSPSEEECYSQHPGSGSSPCSGSRTGLSCKASMTVSSTVPGPCDPEDLIDGIIFAASYLGSTHLLSERTPSKSARMLQAQEAMGRVRTAQKQAKNRKTESEVPSSTEVDLFMSTQRIKVLNADSQESMMDLPLRTISYIADLGSMVVLMARGKMVRSRSAQEHLNHTAEQPEHTLSPARDDRRQYRMVCHVFESEDAQLIAQSIGQAFSVAYQEFLRANGIDPEDLSQREYSDLLNTQDMYNDDLIHFSKSENCRDVYIEKLKGEMLGVVIVESGWGSILPTVIVASMMHSGPAEKSGRLNVGDQIMTINGTSLVGLPLSTCQSIIKGLKAQSRIKLNIVRCPPVTMVLIRRPDLRYQLGFSVQNGIICSLMRGGIAERGGVRVGHRIIEINGQSVVATPHEKIVHILSNAVGEIHMKTMPAAMYRLLTAQEQPVYI
uniref:Amyloid beta precursor protein binding family A member 1 n=1 Tax=Esox lucius TaxID=8010 RepID=A0A3P8ZZE0_ESOLU